ncbi:MAG: hypothetical protein ABIR52_03960 [Casimicrobiaceae bacterium]
MGAAAFGGFSMKRAQQAEARAEETRLLAEAARGESEKLVVYLLDDFYQELAPVGRLDIVGALAKRALDYYNALPEALRTTRTERNRALALVRYGAVLRTQERLAEGGKAIDEAVDVLGKMREQGDVSETTAIGLALGLSTQARLASSANQQGKALPISARAVAVIKPLATAENPSAAARKTYGEVLNMHGFLQVRNDQWDVAVATLEDARKALASIDGLKMDDLAAAAVYAEATSWQVQALVDMDRNEEAKRAGKEGLAVASQVLEKRPGHMQALRAQALITSPLVSMLTNEMHLAEALAMSDTTLRAWHEFIRVDPGNTISWGNLAVGYFNRQGVTDAMGRPAETASDLRAALTLETRAPPSILVRRTLQALAGRLALVEADRGNRTEAEEAVVVNRRLLEWLATNTPARTFNNKVYLAGGDAWRVGLLQALGENQRALELGRNTLPQIEQLRSEDPEQARLKNIYLRFNLRAMAQSAYALRDYPTAERYMARILEIRKTDVPRELGEKREAAFEQAWAALVLTRLNRPADARPLIEPVLKMQRGLATHNLDDPSQRMELAMALHVAALAGIGDPVAQQAEAAALFDRLPPAMRSLRSVAVLGNDIAEDRKRLRK